MHGSADLLKHIVMACWLLYKQAQVSLKATQQAVQLRWPIVVGQTCAGLSGALDQVGGLQGEGA